MKKQCLKLQNDIIDASKTIQLDPYNNSFCPNDLGLIASKYGCFADHCKKGTTVSAKHCGCGLLKLVSKNPHRYILAKYEY